MFGLVISVHQNLFILITQSFKNKLKLSETSIAPLVDEMLWTESLSIKMIILFARVL